MLFRSGLFVLCSVLVLATATITQFDKLLLNNATFMYQRYYMYDQHFSGGKDASSFIELQLSIQKNDPATVASGVIDGVIMTEAVFNAMGYNNNGVKSFCCDRNAVSQQLCKEEQALLFPQGMEGEYTRISLPVKEEVTRMSLHLTIEKEGLYYVMVGSCQAKTSNIALNGYSEAKNTYGELPATLYGELPFNLVLIGLFSLGLLYWVITCYRHAKSILSVHRIIKYILISCVVECIAYRVNALTLNSKGSSVPALNLLSILTHFTSQGLLRLLLLCIASGSGSVDDAHIISPSFGFFFVTIYSILQTSFELHRNTHTSISIFASSLPVLVETVITFFIISSVTETVQKLTRNNETTKLHSFRVLFVLLGLLSLLIVSLNVLFLLSDMEKLLRSFWKAQWFFLYGFWQACTAFCVFSIMCVWKPSDNSIQYVSHIQLATDENLPSVDDKEARIGIVEGEEVHRVVNEVQGTNYIPMEMEK